MLLSVVQMSHACQLQIFCSRGKVANQVCKGRHPVPRMEHTVIGNVSMIEVAASRLVSLEEEKTKEQQQRDEKNKQQKEQERKQLKFAPKGKAEVMPRCN